MTGLVDGSGSGDSDSVNADADTAVAVVVVVVDGDVSGARGGVAAAGDVATADGDVGDADGRRTGGGCGGVAAVVDVAREGDTAANADGDLVSTPTQVATGNDSEKGTPTALSHQWLAMAARTAQSGEASAVMREGQQCPLLWPHRPRHRQYAAVGSMARLPEREHRGTTRYGLGGSDSPRTSKRREGARACSARSTVAHAVPVGAVWTTSGGGGGGAPRSTTSCTTRRNASSVASVGWRTCAARCGRTRRRQQCQQTQCSDHSSVQRAQPACPPSSTRPCHATPPAPPHQCDPAPARTG